MDYYRRIDLMLDKVRISQKTYGCDLIELFSLWNMSFNDSIDDIKIITQFLQIHVYPYFIPGNFKFFNKTRFSKKAIKDLRKYVYSVSENNPSGMGKILYELSQIEDDFTFIKLFDSLIYNLWS